jgi:hypothetical protein
MRVLVFSALTGLVLLTGCQRETAGGPVELAGKLFVFNYRVATAYYEITLRKTAPVAEGSVAEASFENPRGGARLMVRQPVFAANDRIVLQSPMIHCVVKDRRYAVTIRMLGADGGVLQTIETTVVSDVDQTVLPAKPLVVGPGYAKNPEVFKPDGSQDFSSEADCPA